jgi:hypothetical protein
MAEREKKFDESYWLLMKQIMEYSIDSSPKASLTVDGKEVSRLDEDGFLTHLYACRAAEDYEAKLRKHILDCNTVLCVVGHRGSGKTSTLRYVCAEIVRLHPDHRIVILDMKVLHDQEYFRSVALENFESSIRLGIRNKVRAKLFPSSGDTKELLAWCFGGAPDHSDPFSEDLVSDLHAAAVAMQVETGTEAGSRTERVRGIRSMIDRDPSLFKRAQQDIEPLLRTAQVLQAAVSLGRCWRVVLIYDNIDRLPARAQPLFLDVVNDFHIALGGRCATIVAIRRENIRGEIKRDGEGSDVISVFPPNSAAYKGVLLEQTTSQHVRAVLSKRETFARALYQQHASSSEKPAPAHPMHDGVVNEFVESSIHAVANGSLRAVTDMYTCFLQHLNSLIASKDLELADLDASRPESERHLHTVFFLWLRENAGHFGVLPRHHSRGNSPQVATWKRLPQHLVLTRLQRARKES